MDLGERRGPKGSMSIFSLHAGLVCLNGPVGMDLALQRELFSEALDELDVNGHLTNQIIEVTLEDSKSAFRSCGTAIRARRRTCSDK